MIGARLLQSALLGGALWSGAELLRLASLGLLRFSGPGALVLFVAGHVGLCVGGAAAVALAYAAPSLLTARRGPLLGWAAALTGLLLGAGARLSFHAPPARTLPLLLGGAAPAALAVALLSRDLPSLRAGRPVPSKLRRAALCALLGAGACAVNQRFLPQQLFHFHGAVTALGLGLCALLFAYALPRPLGGAAPAALALMLAGGAAPAVSIEARHALFVLGQESRAVIYAARKLTRSAGDLREWRGAASASEAPATAPLPCGPALARRLVLVSIDSLRADHLRAYGYPRETAPQLSALARHAVLFERAYTLAPSTSPAVRRFFAVSDGPGPVSRLGEALGAAGVRARAVVAEPMGRYFGEGVDRLFAAIEAVPVRGDVIDRALAPAAARALAAPAAGPELLWVHLQSPHLPYLRWPEGPDFGAAPADRYDGEIAEADRALGQIVAAAERHPLASETAFVVTADHGEELGDHGGAAHGRYGMFQEEIHVPLLIALPGVAPRRVAQDVSHDDVAATLAALFGACGPGFRGRSLVPALRGEDLRPSPILVGPRTPLWAGALIEGRYKLAYVLFNRSLALYDLEADPAERLNLMEALPAEAARMTALLRAQLAALPPGYRPQVP